MEILSFQNIDPIITLLNDNKVIALPTESVFGLAISSKIPSNYDRLMDVKQRDYSKPLPIVVGSIEMIKEICEISPRNEYLINKYLPGVMTFILPLKDGIFPYLNHNTIAIRYSSDQKVSNLVLEHGYALWLSSANISNEKTGTKFEEVYETFKDSISGIIQGECIDKVSSTIYDLTKEEIVCLRKGKEVMDDEDFNG